MKHATITTSIIANGRTTKLTSDSDTVIENPATDEGLPPALPSHYTSEPAPAKIMSPVFTHNPHHHHRSGSSLSQTQSSSPSDWCLTSIPVNDVCLGIQTSFHTGKPTHQDHVVSTNPHLPPTHH
ncbi:hypothetical protein HPP92_012809 [Vanilla planifolia]|uniref:Uncharacterized protein n=1 Tax=Vanilla planifolia TaxID=51239 RepID=A0A835UZE3_VANPL|nr:hypothetical protein HPP92_012809 [Vanilla planifolia]